MMTEKKKDWSAWEDWIEKNRPPKPEIKYNPNHKRTKGAEKRIRSFLRRRKTFILHTVSVEDNKTKETWYVDSGGWASVMIPNTDKFSKSLGHIVNCLEFLGGSQPIWYDPTRPEKRSYVRRNVKRGGL